MTSPPPEVRTSPSPLEPMPTNKTDLSGPAMSTEPTTSSPAFPPIKERTTSSGHSPVHTAGGSSQNPKGEEDTNPSGTAPNPTEQPDSDKGNEADGDEHEGDYTTPPAASEETPSDGNGESGSRGLNPDGDNEEDGS